MAGPGIARRPLRDALVVTVALAAGIVLGQVAPPAAHAGGEASVTTVFRSADAAAQPALHVGVRQAAVGDPIPVTIVGAETGTVWEIVLADPETVVGSVTIGQDGTGTTLVALPVDATPGSVELTASTAGAQISTTLSSAGDTSAPPAETEREPGATDAAPASPIAPPLVVVGAAVGLLLLAAIALVAATRHRRRAAR